MTDHLHRKTIWLGVALMVAIALIGGMALWPFETLSKLAVVAAIIRGGLIALLAWAVFGKSKMDYVSRAFLGLTTVAMTMTVQSLLVENTPYELWAAILASLGLLGYFARLFGFGLWHRIAQLAGDEPK